MFFCAFFAVAKVAVYKAHKKGSLPRYKMHFILVALLACCAQAVSPPGALFNLSAFQLQLPVSNGNGGVEVIQAAALTAGYTSEYFYTNTSTMAMTFWTPENGAHTSGSSYARTELRQQPNFVLSGRSQLNVTMAVFKLPSGGSITVGQIHFDKISGHCSIVIELEYTSGSLVAHLRDSACKGVTKTVGSGYVLGQSFSFSLNIDGLNVQATSDTGTMAPYAYDWAIQGCNQPIGKCPLYFKTGCYIQSSSSSSTNGGIVSISDYAMNVAV